MILRLALAFLLWPTLAWAQPSPTVVTTFESNTNANTYTVTSGGGTFELLANRLILLMVYAADAGGASTANPDTPVGHSLTWVAVNNLTQAFHGLHLYCAKTTVNVTDDIDVGFSVPGTQNHFAAAVVSWSGADLSGDCDDAIVAANEQQHNANSTDTSTITFNAFSDSNNRPFVVWMKNLGASTATTDWTELWDDNLEALRTYYGMWDDATDDTTATVTWSDTTSALVLGIGVEIIGAATGAPCLMGGGMCSGGFISLKPSSAPAPALSSRGQ